MATFVDATLDLGINLLEMVFVLSDQIVWCKSEHVRVESVVFQVYARLFVLMKLERLTS